VLFRSPAPTRTTTPTTRAAAAPAKPKPTTTTQPPATTTTAPPTTTTTAAPPPVEVAAAVEPPPPPETTTTTAPRPIFTNPDFLAANFSDRFLTVATSKPVPGRPLAPIFLAAALGVLVGSACTVVGLKQAPQLASELSRLRHWR